jgi:autotransporter-associated beta strand protein
MKTREVVITKGSIGRTPTYKLYSLAGGKRLLCTGLLATLTLSNLMAADVFKNSTSGNLNTTAVWTGSAVPGPNDVAVFDSGAGAALANALGANLAWAGIRIANPTGPVLINPGNFLTNGTSGFDLSAASQNLTLSNNTVLSGFQNWNVASGKTLAFGGSIARNTNSGVRITLADGTANVFVTNGVNGALLGSTFGGIYFATLNDTDFAGLQTGVSGLQVVPGASISGLYTNNAAAAGANPTINTVPVVLDITSTGSYGTRLSGAGAYPAIRFSIPQTYIGVNSVVWNGVPAWQINHTGGRILDINAILVTAGCGTSAVLDSGGGNIRIGNTGNRDLFIFQNNPSAPLVLQNSVLQSTNRASSVVKTGVGIVEMQTNSPAALTNANPLYAGGTFIYQGILSITGAGQAGSGLISVLGGTFQGTSGSTNIAPTTVSAGATNLVLLTATNGTAFYASNVTLMASSHIDFNWSNSIPFSTTVAAMTITNPSTTLVLSNNTLVDILANNLAVGQYPLIKYGALGGDGFNALTLGAIQPHVVATLSNNVANSSIDLVVSTVNLPLKWATGNGTWDLNSSPNWKDGAGGTTTYQQNGPVADSVLFEDTQSGGSPISVALNQNLTPGSVTVSASKTYTISGGGSIGGNGVVTKAGSGTLTLGNANTFTGGININGGILVFSSLANLGPGAINFGGGTLQYNGNADDISVQTVTFGPGGGAIDVGSGNITYNNGIGNNGTGGLIKKGSGTLTLTHTNVFSGVAEVQAGLLDLNNNILNVNTRMSNCAAIVVDAGASFGSQDGGVDPVVLSPTANQILAGGTGGVASIVGNDVISPAGTTITPGTNGVVGTLYFPGNLEIGGTIVYDVSTTSHDLMIVGGILTVDPCVLQVNASGILTNGSYEVLAYGTNGIGTLAGSLANVSVVGFSQSGNVASLFNDTANKIIYLRVKPAGNGHKTWGGYVNNNWNVELDANWTTDGGTTHSNYLDGDYVFFSDFATLGTLSIPEVVLPAGISVNTVNTLTLNDGGVGGGITGGTGITNLGSGTLTLETQNNNVGPTIIQNGTFQVGGDGKDGSLGIGNITNNGAFVLNQTQDHTIKGSVSGTGSVTQMGGNTVTLAGSTTYTGPTTISAGTLIVGTGGTAAGTLATSTITNNGTLNLNSGTSWTFSGGIKGTGALTKSGTNTFILAGANSYSGATTVSNGIFRANPGSLPFTPVSVFGGKLDLVGSDLVPNGFGVVGIATGGLIVNDVAANQTNVITFGTNNTLADFSGAILNNDGGTFTGKVAVLKIGTGTMTLRGTNNYTGGTHVISGTFQVASSAVTIPGTVLMENGTIFDMFQQGGGPLPTNNLALASGATVTMDANALGNALSGQIIGDAASTLIITNGTGAGGGISLGAGATNQLQAFLGTVHVVSNAINTNSILRFSGSGLTFNGGDSTTFILDPGCTLYTRNGTGAGPGVSLGSLFGSGFIGGDQTPPGAGVYIIGRKGSDCTFSGTLGGINDPTLGATANQTCGYTKDGGAKLTLDGILLYDGQTTVSNGTLIIGSVSNPNTALTNSSGYAIGLGGTLDLSATVGGTMNGTLTLGDRFNTTNGFITNQFITGSGTLKGNLVSTSGRVNPGDGIGTLSVTGNASLSGGSMTMEINMTNANVNDELSVSGTINLTGCALTVTNIGPTLKNGTTFQLFNKGITGPSTLTLPGAPYVWVTNLTANGSITLTSGGVNAAAGKLQASVTGGGTTLSLNWPTNLGWTLMVQTNRLSSGLSGVKSDWAAVPGSTAVTTTNIAIVKTNPTTFYRLVLPY